MSAGTEAPDSMGDLSAEADGRRLVVETGGAYTFWDVASWQRHHEVPKHPEFEPGHIRLKNRCVFIHARFGEQPQLY